MAKFIDLFKRRFCWHSWARWSDPVDTYNTGHKQQWRVCQHCNKAQFHTLLWDKQTSVGEVLKAVKQSQGAIPSSTKE